MFCVFGPLCAVLTWLTVCRQTALLTVVRRDSFAASEKEIFLALSRWCRQHVDGSDTHEVMAAVRLPLMTLTEMLNVVRPSGLLSPDDLLDAIKTRSESRNMDLNYRGMLSEWDTLRLRLLSAATCLTHAVSLSGLQSRRRTSPP